MNARGPEAMVRTIGLCVRYHGRLALRDVDLALQPHRILALVGPSGCGKSSLLRCLNRLDTLIPGCAVEGEIQIAGRSVEDWPLIELRRRVGLIFQKPNPFPLSVRRNLTFPLREHGTRDRGALEEMAQRALLRVGLWDEVKDRLDAPALSLSGGQQQRLCIARALALEPSVLLLDEPCSALDPLASGVVEDLIAELREQYTVVVVTHNLAQARRLADEVAVFWHQDGAGALIESGAAEQVFSSPQHPLTADYISGARG